MELKTQLASKKIKGASNIEYLDEDIDGEYFTVKRSYLMRPSTVRKLNALKAEHPNLRSLFFRLLIFPFQF